MKKIELGNRVTDIVTGLEGIAVARVEYLNGCVQLCIQQKKMENAVDAPSAYIDEGQLQWKDDGVTDIVKANRSEEGTGGPSRYEPKGLPHP